MWEVYQYLLVHSLVGPPAHKEHGKVHGTHCKDKVEEPITVWHIAVHLTPILPCDLIATKTHSSGV